MGEIRWKPKDVQRIFTHAELFSTLAIYEEFREQGDDYLDNLKPSELRRMFVRELNADNIPSQAMDSLHRLFDKTVEDFSSYLKDSDEFKRRVKEGAKDPIRKMTTNEKFTNALKFVLVYRIAAEKKTTLSQAKEQRERVLRLVQDLAQDLLMNIVMSTTENILMAADKYDLDSEAVKRLSLRIDDIFDEGLATRLCLDGEPLEFHDDLGELLKKKKKSKDDDSFNPMFG